MAIPKSINGAPVPPPGSGYVGNLGPAHHHYHVLDSALRNYDIRSECAYRFMLDLLWRLNVIE